MHAEKALFPGMHITFKTYAAQEPQESAYQIPTKTLSSSEYINNKCKRCSCLRNVSCKLLKSLIN